MQLLIVQLTCELRLTDGERVQGRGERTTLMRATEENEECSTGKNGNRMLLQLFAQP